MIEINFKLKIEYLTPNQPTTKHILCKVPIEDRYNISPHNIKHYMVDVEKFPKCENSKNNISIIHEEINNVLSQFYFEMRRINLITDEERNELIIEYELDELKYYWANTYDIIPSRNKRILINLIEKERILITSELAKKLIFDTEPHFLKGYIIDNV